MARTRGMALEAANKKTPSKVTKPKSVAGDSKSKKGGKKEKVEKAIESQNTKESKNKKTENESSTVEVPVNVTDKALGELYKFVSKNSSEKESEKPSLFDDEAEDENDLFLQVQMKKFCAAKPEFKPKLIKLSSSIYDTDNLSTCLIVRDDLVTKEAQLEQIENANIPTLSKIYTLTQVKKEFKTYEKRRELFSSHDLFVVDDALLNMLPTVLGKVFYGYSHNKVPLPIRVTNSSNNKQFSTTTIKNQIEKCLLSTYYLPPVGVNISIKVGTLTENNDKNVTNVANVLSAFEKSKVRSIMVKTKSSPSLPLFYTDSLYDENTDVISEEQPSKDDSEDNDSVRFTSFEKGLLELGDVDDVEKLIGKKMKESSRKKHRSSKKKITKLSKA